jgi:hypothetical protein
MLLPRCRKCDSARNSLSSSSVPQFGPLLLFVPLTPPTMPLFESLTGLLSHKDTAATGAVSGQAQTSGDIEINAGMPKITIDMKYDGKCHMAMVDANGNNVAAVRMSSLCFPCAVA